MNNQPYLINIAITQIAENPLQPRTAISDIALQQLADSIAQQGVVQPIIIRPHPHIENFYQLIAGERRLQAMRLLGWQKAPALVRQIPDEQMLEVALVENIQREPLNPIEEASAYRLLMTSLQLTQAEMAKRVGKERSTVANMLRLLSLPPLLKEDLETGKLSIGHARALLSLPWPEQQIALRNIVYQAKLSVRETERLVEHERNSPAKKPKTLPKAISKTVPSSVEQIHYQAAENSLARLLGTKVQIMVSSSVQTDSAKMLTGEIRLHFHSEDDFNRLYSHLNQNY